MDKSMKVNFIEKPDLDKSEVSEKESLNIFQRTVFDIKKRFNNVDEKKLNKEQKNRFDKIKEKLENSSKKLFNTIKWVVLVVGVLEVAQYKRTHLKLDIYEQTTGGKEYKHSDQRTTHFLNVLSGREKFTEQDIRFEWNSLIREYTKETEQKLDKDPDDMTIDELDEVAFISLSKMDTTMKRGDFKKNILEEVDRYGTPDTSEYKPSNDIYELVWQLEQECGNPKIRFASEDINFTPSKEFRGSLHYNPITNTIFISPSDISPNSKYFKYNSLIAELSHGKQYSENPVGSSFQYISDFTSVLFKGGFNINAINNEYHNLYNKPGSFENETHKVIEPYLHDKYKLFIKK